MSPLNPTWLLICGLVVVVHWGITEQLREKFLLMVSLVYCGWLDPVSLGVALGSGALFYWTSAPDTSPVPYRLSLGFLVLLFGGLQFVHQLQSPLGWPSLGPIGFGFYALRLIHYGVERRSGHWGKHTFTTFLNYLLFFPAFSTGPIHLFGDWLRAERRKRYDPAMIGGGLDRVLVGYAKILLLAQWGVTRWLEPWLVVHLTPGTPLAIFAEATVYGLHLYLTFAGFSDLAIGVGLLLGYPLAENFDRPFTRRNLGEFWQTWNASLSLWVRRYVFVPVVAYTRSPTLGVVSSLFLISVWHELTLRYLLWGAWNGLGILVWQTWSTQVVPHLPQTRSPWLRQIGELTSILLTFTFVMTGFVILKNPTAQGGLDEMGVLLWPF